MDRCRNTSEIQHLLILLLNLIKVVKDVVHYIRNSEVVPYICNSVLYKLLSFLLYYLVLKKTTKMTLQVVLIYICPLGGITCTVCS